MGKISILIVSDQKEGRETLRKSLNPEDMEIRGIVNDARQSVRLAKAEKVEVVLMDLRQLLREAIPATRAIIQDNPQCAVIIFSEKRDLQGLRQAMRAGVRDFLLKPFQPEELISTIREISRNKVKENLQGIGGRVISVYSPRGGAGKTILAVNLATCLVQELKQQVVLVDLNLRFGTAHTFLNLKPQHTILDVASNYERLDPELIKSSLTSHSSGMKILASSSVPEYLEAVSISAVEKILQLLSESFEYIIIDVPTNLEDVGLVALNFSERILLITLLELAALQNTRTCLEMFDSLYHSRDKINLILNRCDASLGIEANEVESILNQAIFYSIPSDGRTTVTSGNLGIPFVLSYPTRPISRSIRELARKIVGEEPQSSRKPAFASLKTLFKRKTRR